MNPIPVFLEIGEKRVFAGAVNWFGWYGQGRNELSALESFLRNGSRFQQVIQTASIGFETPTSVDELHIVERLPSNDTTDFGAPDVPPTSDPQTVDEQELHRALALFEASWAALQRAYQGAIGKELRKGPRGGGRELVEIIDHVLNAHESYLRRINWKATRNNTDSIDAAISRMASESSKALTSTIKLGLPERGVRGGAIWKPRTLLRS